MLRSVVAVNCLVFAMFFCAAAQHDPADNPWLAMGGGLCAGFFVALMRRDK